MERKRKETIVTEFDALFKNFSGSTEENLGIRSDDKRCATRDMNKLKIFGMTLMMELVYLWKILISTFIL